MIPIKLSIQGLYSYQKIQEVDFQRLTGSSVFGIFGKVGSGKTSLLEAISFALYGETERLNSRDNRPYNMMNLKSKHLLIDFEFQAGPDQQVYKFVYEAKRHPKKHHEIGPGERRLFIWQGTDWHPIGNEKEDVAILSKQIIGLDYENFKRTIIIPQNQFREFLELSPAERTKMMNQLFKLDQYDLAGRVGKLNKANDNQLAELRGLLSPLETVTPEAVEQAKSAIDELHEQVAEKTGQLDKLIPIEQQLLHLQKQNDSLVWAQGELDRWVAHEPEFRRIQEDISRFEQCRLLFQADLANADKLQNRQTELLDSSQKGQNKLDTLTTRLPALQEVYKATKTAYENRNSVQKQVDELDTVQQIRTLQDSIERLSKNQTFLESQRATYKTQLEEYKAERKKQQILIDNQFGLESTVERLYKIQNWFSVYKSLKKQADTLQEQLDKHDAKIRTLKQRKDDALTGFPEWIDLTLKTLPAHIDQALERLKISRKQSEDAYQSLVFKRELQHYAESLTDGIPCPLCGATHHPARQHDGTTEAEAQQAGESLKKVRQQIEDTTALRLLVNGLETELRAVLDNSKLLTNDRGELVQQLTAHEDLFVWPEFTREHEGAVEEAIVQEGTYQNQLKDAQNAVRELNKTIDEAETELTKITEALATTNTGIAGLNGQLKPQVESLEHYKLLDVMDWDLAQIDEVRQLLTQQYGQIKSDFDEAEKCRNEAEKEQAALQEQVQQLTKQLADLATDRTTQEEHYQ